MKKIIMSLIVILLVGALSACGMEMDGKNLNSSKKEETETQVSNELEKALSTQVEGSESESTVFETEEITSEGDYPGADVVEIVNLRGDETTVYKLVDGTYMDRINRRFTYNGTDTWTDEDGIEWNEAVKTSANDNSSNNVNEVPEGAGWKADLEKSLFENYGVVPKYYEDLGDGSYQVYAEVGGEILPFAILNAATGEYQLITTEGN